MTIHERLRTARRDAGFASAAAAAKAFGWPIGTYSCHENGSRGIKLDVAERYARAFGVDPVWLLRGGKGPTLGERMAKDFRELARQIEAVPEEPHALLAALHEVRREIGSGTGTRFNTRANLIEDAARELFGSYADALALAPGNENLLNDTQPVKVVALAAVAGGGADATSEEIVGHVWFRREWLEPQGIEPASCVVIGVQGASMWPRLEDGDSILVDRSRTKRLPDSIFVFRTRDGLVVNRIVEYPDGEWWHWNRASRSGLEPYPEDAEIFGQVVWAGRPILEPADNGRTDGGRR